MGRVLPLVLLPTIGTNPWVYQDPHDVEMHGGVVANQSNTYETVNGTMVENGPYVMQMHTPNEQLVLVATRTTGSEHHQQLRP